MTRNRFCLGHGMAFYPRRLVYKEKFPRNDPRYLSIKDEIATIKMVLRRFDAEWSSKIALTFSRNRQGCHIEILQEKGLNTDPFASPSGVSTPWKKDIRYVLKARRLALEMTLEELSASSGIHLANLSKIEAGKRPLGHRSLRKISVALQLDHAKLLKLLIETHQTGAKSIPSHK